MANLVFPNMDRPPVTEIALFLSGFDMEKSTDPYDHVGRYRGAWFERDDSELLAVFYTRNGGGNRDCYHAGDPEFGNAQCKNNGVATKERKYINKKDRDEGVLPDPTWQLVEQNQYGVDVYKTPQDYDGVYTCEEPNSIECGCPGCVITYRLPAMPSFFSSDDDDFDITYATVKFKVEKTEENEPLWLAAYDSAEPGAVDMSASWEEAIVGFGGEKDTEDKA